MITALTLKIKDKLLDFIFNSKSFLPPPSFVITLIPASTIFLQSPLQPLVKMLGTFLDAFDHPLILISFTFYSLCFFSQSSCGTLKVVARRRGGFPRQCSHTSL